MRVSLVAAVADNGVIGRDGGLPWHLPEDLARFRRLTMGHHLLVGRRTFESIGRALPGRRMVVVSSGSGALPAGVERAASLAAALARAAAAGDDEAFVAGGAALYAAALPQADRLYLTRVHGEPAGDVRFPPFAAAEWREVERDERPADERHAWPFTFLTYERR
jgi:dihydrofolate reductase